MRTSTKILAFVAALVVLLIAAALLTDWHFLRGPIERIATEQLGRPVALADFRMRLRPLTRIRIEGLRIANLPGAQPGQMAVVDRAEARIHVLPLLRHEVVIEELRVDGGQAHLTRDKNGDNWTLAERDSQGGPKTRFTLRKLGFSKIVLEYRDAALGVDGKLTADTIDDGKQPQYATRLAFSGSYHGGTFQGGARTGSVMSLRDSGAWFPFFIDGRAGTTRLHAEGRVADILAQPRVDVALDISGSSLSTLYPYLPLPLPSTPPYRLRGRLARDGGDFRFTGIDGRIGSSDIEGEASYQPRAGKPFLRTVLKSRALDMKDLGPLIGAGQNAEGEPTPAANADGRILPASEFHLDRLNAIDADARLDAASIKFQGPWAFENLSAHLLLNDGVLKLEPLNFGYAGGTLASDITLDARQPAIRTDARIAVRRARLDRLLPKVELMKGSEGTLGANFEMKTTGNSIRAMLANGDGQLGMAVTRGQLSNLLMEAVGLDAGQALGFLIRGDRPTRLRCAIASFDIKRGRATSQGLVIDTDDTRVDGSGTVDFGTERLDLRFEPHPKDKSLLAARSPVSIVGTFGHPGFDIDKPALLARLGASVALGFVNPLAALIPLIETGPGTDADCRALLSNLREAAKNSGAPAPAAPAKAPTKR